MHFGEGSCTDRLSQAEEGAHYSEIADHRAEIGLSGCSENAVLQIYPTRSTNLQLQ